MNSRKRQDPKEEALQETGTLNPHPERIVDELFLEEEFFDRRDRLQVKYEMLRRVRVEGHSIQGAARALGVSRPTFYKAQADYGRAGLAGLLPAKPGPRGAHKLTAEVMDVLAEELASEPTLRAAELPRRSSTTC